MTAAELRVLETRMDMLDAVLLDLIEQVRRMQLPGRTDQHRQTASGLPVGLVVQGFLQVVADGLVDRAAHEFVCFCEGDPAHFGKFLVIANEGIGAVGWPGRDVDHAAAGLRVDAAADNAAGPDPQAGFLFDLSYRRVGRALAGLDLASDERPGGLAVDAPGYQDAEGAGDDRRDDGGRFRQR